MTTASTHSDLITQASCYAADYLRDVSPEELDPSELEQFADRLERTAELCNWALTRHTRWGSQSGAMRMVLETAEYACIEYAKACRGQSMRKLPTTANLNVIANGLRCIGEVFGEQETRAA